MCNLYSLTTNQDAIRRLFEVEEDLAGNLPAMPGIYPDYPAPVIRRGPDGRRVLGLMRWGLPSSQKAIFDAASKRADKLRAKGKPVEFDRLLRMEPDSGTTNVRTTTSKHWRRWLEPPNRCLVPFSSFSEPGRSPDGAYQPVWFAADATRPPLAFAGIYVPGWTSVRKVKEGETTNDLYGFLTCDPNREVGAVHPKAMPAILRTPQEFDAWLRAPWSEAAALQRPLPDGSLEIVARGPRQDDLPGL